MTWRAGRQGHGRRRLSTTGTLALLVLLAGCTIGPSPAPDLVVSGAGPATTPATATSDTRPVGPGGPGRTAEPLDFADCPFDYDSTGPTDPTGPTGSERTFVIDCANLVVPKIYDAPNDPGTFSISVARARAENTPQDAPMLVVMLDDPGEHPASAIAAVAGSLPAALLERFRIVTMDYRGTGDSAPVACVSGATADDILSLGADPASDAALQLLTSVSRSLTFDCGDLAEDDLTRFATVPTADDLDTLRAALGAETLDLLGRGHGATLGAVYAERYPGRVGALVLDTPADPRLTPQDRATASAEAAEQTFDSFAAACADFDGGCPLGPDPRATVSRTVAALGDSGTLSNDRQLISGGSILLATMLGLGSPDTWPALARALADADTGDVDAIANLLLAEATLPDAGDRLSAGILYACNDSAQRLSGTELQQAAATAGEQAPLFGPFAASTVGLCAGWPAPSTALSGVTAVGAAPVLVLGSVDDPVTAFTGVRSLAGQMNSAVLLSWQSATHGSYPASACITGFVDDYLIDGTVPGNDQLCPP
ncbi:alpha/beta fold hydrolase [Nakamurella sp. YIM 132087]|uniref:Alpha/beta fold hydrolase n=1 Tax=Nakamurella alba TaxID=2665158 RepID=A0A7K1FQI9_9ACTN|nr:alpha/beta hydrolase [Nakamurella alba]MTD16415.1 alpha/beta fold hydrolase [Nakamurella alba]